MGLDHPPLRWRASYRPDCSPLRAVDSWVATIQHVSPTEFDERPDQLAVVCIAGGMRRDEAHSSMPSMRAADRTHHGLTAYRACIEELSTLQHAAMHEIRRRTCRFPGIGSCTPSTAEAGTFWTHAVLAVALSLAVATRVEASILIVEDLADSGAAGQLRSVISAAADGDVIIIAAGTLMLTGEPNEDENLGGDLDIVKNITLLGAGAGSTILDGGSNDRVIDIHPPAMVTISGVTIQYGRLDATLDGGGIRNQGTLLLNGAVVRDNEANASQFLDDGKGDLPP